MTMKDRSGKLWSSSEVTTNWVEVEVKTLEDAKLRGLLPEEGSYISEYGESPAAQTPNLHQTYRQFRRQTDDMVFNEMERMTQRLAYVENELQKCASNGNAWSKVARHRQRVLEYLLETYEWDDVMKEVLEYAITDKESK